MESKRNLYKEYDLGVEITNNVIEGKKILDKYINEGRFDSINPKLREMTDKFIDSEGYALGFEDIDFDNDMIKNAINLNDDEKELVSKIIHESEFSGLLECINFYNDEYPGFYLVLIFSYDHNRLLGVGTFDANGEEGKLFNIFFLFQIR